MEQDTSPAPSQPELNPRILKYNYDMRSVAWDCVRCSSCKWVDPWEIKNRRFAKICPINTHFLADSYSSQGRMDLTLAILDGKLKYEQSDKLLHAIYTCDTCGGCDAMCKRNQDMEPLRVSLDLRAKLVEDGQLLPEHMPMMESLRQEDNSVLGHKAERGRWAEGLDIKDLTRDTGEVVFHAGCHISFRENLWPVGRAAVNVLKAAGVDVGIFGKDEVCCGGRAWDMGYRGTYTKYAEHNIEAWKRAKVKTVVTACADGYYAFKRLYPRTGLEVEVYHIVEYIEKLLGEGRLKLTKSVPMTVTYHDPCHMGRRADEYYPGKAIEGLFDVPRRLLKSVPGVELVEMYRTRENAWCCGAGGGVKQAYPEFALWTAGERLAEAMATGADAIVTACPSCEENFSECLAAQGDDLQVLDVVELVERAL